MWVQKLENSIDSIDLSLTNSDKLGIPKTITDTKIKVTMY